MKRITPERWLPVNGYEHYYAISDHGRVMALERKIIDSLGISRRMKRKIIRPTLSKNGYHFVGLYKENKGIKVSVHSLVLNHFIGSSPSNIHQCNHKDGVKTNNHYSNLEWVTPKQNVLHSFKVLNKTVLSGNDHPNTKLKDHEVKAIRELYAEGEYTQLEISKAFGVSHCHINNIINNKKRQMI